MLRSLFWGTPGGGGGRWGRGPCLEPEPQQWRRGRRSPKAEHLPEIIAQSHHLGATWRVELAQAAATQPSAGSASPRRDRTRAGGRPESNATRIKTIHRHWATVSGAPAAARLCFRKASRPSRPARAPEQKASCLLPPPVGQQPRAEKAPQISTHMRHSRREL